MTIVYIVEPDGDIIASSMEGTTLSADGGQVQALESVSPLIRESYNYTLRSGPAPSIVEIQETHYWILNGKVQDRHDLDWNLTALFRVDCPVGYGLSSEALAGETADLDCEFCERPRTSTRKSFTCNACTIFPNPSSIADIIPALIKRSMLQPSSPSSAFRCKFMFMYRWSTCSGVCIVV